MQLLQDFVKLHMQTVLKNKKLNNEIINRIPMSRWGAKDEINGALDFLISKKSSYITGHILNVDGGWCS